MIATRNSVTMKVLKEIAQLIFWVIILASIFLPHALDFWQSNGFNN